jgi:hypothetical protein
MGDAPRSKPRGIKHQDELLGQPAVEGNNTIEALFESKVSRDLAIWRGD